MDRQWYYLRIVTVGWMVLDGLAFLCMVDIRTDMALEGPVAAVSRSAWASGLLFDWADE